MKKLLLPLLLTCSFGLQASTDKMSDLLPGTILKLDKNIRKGEYNNGDKSYLSDFSFLNKYKKMCVVSSTMFGVFGIDDGEITVIDSAPGKLTLSTPELSSRNALINIECDKDSISSLNYNLGVTFKVQEKKEISDIDHSKYFYEWGQVDGQFTKCYQYHKETNKLDTKVDNQICRNELGSELSWFQSPVNTFDPEPIKCMEYTMEGNPLGTVLLDKCREKLGTIYSKSFSGSGDVRCYEYIKEGNILYGGSPVDSKYCE